MKGPRQRWLDRGWSRVAVTVLPAAFLMNVDRQALVVVSPMLQKEFGYDLVAIAQILTITSWLYALMQIPGAWLAGWKGPYVTIGLCALAWSLVMLATPLAAVPLAFIVLRALLGAFQAPDWLSSIMVLEREFPVDRRSRASAALLGASYLGAILSGPIATSLAVRWGWRACFIVSGLVGVTFAVVLLRNATRHAAMRPAGSILRLASGRIAAGIELLKDRRVTSLAALYFFFSGVQSFVYILLPVYLANERHSTMLELGWLASAPFVALWIGVVLSGLLSDAVLRRTRSLFRARVPAGIVAMLGSSVCFAAGIAAPSLGTMISLTCVGMALVGLGQVIFWSMVQDAADGSGGGATACVQICGALGVAVTPIACAHLVKGLGTWEPVGYTLLGAGICATLLLWSSGLAVRRFDAVEA